jgi:hypothetical protein
MTWKDTLLKEEKKTMRDFIDLVEKSRVRFEKEMKELQKYVDDALKENTKKWKEENLNPSREPNFEVGKRHFESVFGKHFDSKSDNSLAELIYEEIR